MHTHKTEEPRVTIDSADLHEIYPGGWQKRLARRMGEPINTVRSWFYKHMSTTRTVELARALLAEMDAQEPRRAAVRRKLEVVVGDQSGGAVGASLGRAGGGVGRLEDRNA